MDLCSAVGYNGIGIGIGDDLWYEILSKLPLKPLMISKCVCKSWHQLASKIIINQSIPKNPISGFFITSIVSMIFRRESFDYLPIEREDDDEEKKKKRSCYTDHYRTMMFLPSHSNAHILDSRDGFLLCSSNCLQKDYFLYNPITRQCVSLPTPPIPTIGTVVNATAKLVFDDSSDFYYRVIRIAIGYGNINADDWNLGYAKFDSPHMSVDVYSSETGKWVTSKELELPRCYFPSCSVFFDGGIYLLAGASKDDSKILRFDVNGESCGFVWSPPGSSLNSSDCLGVCEGHLCYAQCIKKDGGHCVEVWKFDDDKEWVLKYNVKDFSEWDFQVLTFHPYLTALLVRRLDGFRWFDLAKGNFKRTMSCYPIKTAGDFIRFKAYPFSECYTHRRL